MGIIVKSKRMGRDNIETVIDYLFHEQKRGIDVIILAVLGTIIGVIIIWLFNKLKAHILSYMRKLILKLKRYYRKVIKGELRPREFYEIQRKVNNGIRVSSHDKRAFKKTKLQMIEQAKAIADKHNLPKIETPKISKEVLDKLTKGNKYDI
jgi:uncharacterized membrane protein YhiD involved in acid resistance